MVIGLLLVLVGALLYLLSVAALHAIQAEPVRVPVRVEERYQRRR